jgi:hypothetical protein
VSCIRIREARRSPPRRFCSDADVSLISTRRSNWEHQQEVGRFPIAPAILAIHDDELTHTGRDARKSASRLTSGKTPSILPRRFRRKCTRGVPPFFSWVPHRFPGSTSTTRPASQVATRLSSSWRALHETENRILVVLLDDRCDGLHTRLCAVG